MINYSQKEQDKWVIEEVFSHKKGGYFLDLAAADGLKHSNTATLELFYGWSGLAIEPNPVFFNQLSKNRSCSVDRSVIWSEDCNVDFRIDNGQKGGVISDRTDNSYKRRSNQLNSIHCEVLKLKTKTLMEVLREHNSPSHIDYWSFDVAGSEEDIISTLDFSQYSFGCITIERPTKKCNEILRGNGYIFVKNYKFDSFYVHPKNLGDLKLEKFEQIPPKTS